jgi:plastocyanin
MHGRPKIHGGRRLVALGAAVGIALGAVSGGSAFAGAAKTIKVGDNYFVKPGGATITVRRGTTVTWRWAGSSTHNVTVRKGPARFASRTQTRGSFSRRLTQRGTYSLICTIHGSAVSMKLRVT